MSLKAYLARALTLPVHVAAYRALGLAVRVARQHAGRRRDHWRPTLLDDQGKALGALRWRVNGGRLQLPRESLESLAKTSALYLQHRFDLLGSGWVEVRHGLAAGGLDGHCFQPGPMVAPDPDGRWLEGRLNPANLERAKRVWRFVRHPYVPIDWQLDFKSGYRWMERRHFRDIRYGDRAGADVKVPWELSRLQHLPQLALAFRLAAEHPERFAPPERYRCEICNQVLDFVATNPPRFGVNWACAMEVAIRVVNILVAVDLLRDGGAALEKSFLDMVQFTVRDHARHILANLEWSPERRGNHYLVDIIGLLFAAAYLPRDSEVDAWAGFALRELLNEIEQQFLADGGNIEASTGYHRLSAEAVLFAAALVLGFDDDEIAAYCGSHPPLNIRAAQPSGVLPLHDVGDRRTVLHPSVFATVVKAAALSRDATKPDGCVVQWGDTDSGRLLKLQPAWRYEAGSGAEAGWREDPLDHRSFIAGCGTLMRQPDLAAFAGHWVDVDVLTALARNRRVTPDPGPALEHHGTSKPDFDLKSWAANTAFIGRRRVTEIELPGGCLQGVVRAAYPEFGHFVFRGPRFFLAVRCPAIIPPLRGHAHDDTLAIELQVDGRALFTDPGTYVYTPLPDERNAYRRAAAHSVPRPRHHAGLDISQGLFEAGNLLAGHCLYFGPQGFAGEIARAGWSVTRVLALQPERLIVTDIAANCELAPLAPVQELPRVCLGYGRKTAHSPRVV
jgi:hypothetical protein